MAENDITLIQLKHAGGWRSDQVAQEYIDETKKEKLQIASRLTFFQGESKDAVAQQEEEKSCKKVRYEGENFESHSSITIDMSSAQNCSFTYFAPTHTFQYQR